ncbi:MAG: hypothetical protein WD114_02840 [Phycisphaerales bacterium]
MRTQLYIYSLIPAIAAAGSMAAPIYSTDFEQWSNPDGLWSSAIRSDLGGPYTTVLGRFASQTIDFNLIATEQNTSGLGNGGGPGTDAFNLKVKKVGTDGPSWQHGLDGSGGGGQPGTGGSPSGDIPRVNLSDALQGGGSREVAFGPGTYALTFDLMIFDSWDADYEGYGPDSFAVDINGERMFDELFEVHWLPNNFRMADELPELNAFNSGWQDQIYRDISLSFEVTESMDAFSFSFIGTTSQAIHDESWGLDNVRVDYMGSRSASVPEVPAPGSLALLAAGLGLSSRRSRRA